MSDRPKEKSFLLQHGTALFKDDSFVSKLCLRIENSILAYVEDEDELRKHLLYKEIKQEICALASLQEKGKSLNGKFNLLNSQFLLIKEQEEIWDAESSPTKKAT